MQVTDFLEIAGGTRIGRNRQKNEDNFFFCRHTRQNAALAVVADGVGGLSYGHLASYICCKYLRQYFDETETLDENFLKESLESINQRLFRRNVEELRLKPMSCTVAAMLLLPNQVIVANAGDSRAYEFPLDESGRHQAHLLSTDHLPDHADAAKIQRQYHHSAKSLVTSAIGIRHDPEITVRSYPASPGGRYLLCSDGLLSCLRITRINAIVDEAESAESLTDKLLKTGEKLGCRDDITAISIFLQNGGTNATA